MALLAGCALVAVFIMGIAYLLWGIVGIFLFFGFKKMANDTKEEMS